MKHFSTFFLFLFIASASYASTLSGYIYDKDSKEQLVGATVSLQPGSLHTASLLNGKYQFNNLHTGKYELKISYLGYKTIDTTINVGDDNLKINFYLSPNFSSLNTVTISATGNKESDAYAKKIEQRANSIVNIVSANSIAISPDITVANVMARVSGVSVERGQYR